MKRCNRSILLLSFLLSPFLLQGQKVYLEATGSGSKSYMENGISQSLNYIIDLSLNWEALNPFPVPGDPDLLRYTIGNLKGEIADTIHAIDQSNMITIANNWLNSVSYDLQLGTGYIHYSLSECRIVYLNSSINPIAAFPTNHSLEYIADSEVGVPGKIIMRIDLPSRWSWLGNKYELEGLPRFGQFGFIDDFPDYSLDNNEDSDNYFLRQHHGDPDAGAKADYEDLDIYYWVTPEDPDSVVVDSIRIRIYAGEDNTLIETIDGQKVNGEYAVGDRLHVVWENVPTNGAFPNTGFYRIQLAYYTDGFGVPQTTQIEDGDPDLPGWQCPPDGLAIHDLVYKHRPVIYMSGDEVVCPSGPIHPFDPGYVSRYRLMEQWSSSRGTRTKTVAPYATFNSFPQPDFPLDDTYPVLSNYLLPSYPTGIVILDIENTTRNVAPDFPSYVFSRGHPQAHPNYVFIQYWLYYPASYSPQATDFNYNSIFYHEGDWEMVQACIQLRGPADQCGKAHWLLPYAVTASQHYYGQTCAWRVNKTGTGSTISDQRYVELAVDPFRFNIYIAENSHATHFRAWKLKTAFEKCGTQIQYEEPGLVFDIVKNPTLANSYTLVTLEKRGSKGIFDWKGVWGLNGKTPPSPMFRNTNSPFGSFPMDANPVRFHQECRKMFPGFGKDLFTELINP